MTSTSLLHSSLTVRMAAPYDAPALARIAELDSASPPTGRVLVAIVDGRPLAALSLDTGTRIADPFVHTADLVAILEDRAAKIQATARRHDHRRVLHSAASRLRRARRPFAA